jgi:putative pyruvate formate lyase activating enzyme
LRCVFCQNYDISHLGNGETVDSNQLAKLMMFLQQSGCHNINFVTPTHYVPQIISALPVAIEMGLRIPLVYNCGGYESVEAIALLADIIDIYMPDTKFADEIYAVKYMNAPSYFTNLKNVLKEMQRQVGDLQLNDDGIACRGLIIRHLVMPELIAGSAEIFRFIAQEISMDAYVNIMNQYHPCYEAFHDKTLNQLITTKEYHRTIKMAQEVGLHRGF